MHLTDEWWTVLERLIGAILRLVVGYERHARNDLGFLQIGCIRILLRQGI